MPPVKLLRIFILLLLAVLLPIRGVAAAAMQCESEGTTNQAAVQVHAHASQHESSQAHGHPQEVGHSDASEATDKCGLCCDLCSVSPIVGNLPSVPFPQFVATTTFPALSAPSPSFLSEGQERPPRSI